MTPWEADCGPQRGVSCRGTAELAVGHQLSTCLPCVPGPSQLRRATGLLLANGLHVEVTRAEASEPVHVALGPAASYRDGRAAWFAETTHGGKTSRKVTDSLWTCENKKATEVSGLSLITT